MRNLLLFFTCLIFSIYSGYASTPTPSGQKSLEGIVKDKTNGETLIGVSIYFPNLQKGSVTNENGHYKINNLPAIKTTIQITYIGHQPIIATVDLSATRRLNFELEESSARINEVVVTALSGNSLIERTPAPMSIVSKTELLQTSSSNIVDALALQPGISQVTTGSGISKPVIRGLGYNRVVVVNDGTRQEGQQWGDEHGIEIDEQAVHSVEILKGPASLMYGSDALAGVINFLPAPSLPEGKREVNLYSEFQTNNGMFVNSINTAGNMKGFVWNWRYSDKRSHAYKNKYDGYVYNSGATEQALSGLLGLNKSWGYSHLTLSYYKLTPGIITGDRDKVSGHFVKPQVGDNGSLAHIETTHDDAKSYGHGMPYQRVRHYKAVFSNNILLGGGNLKAIVGYQQNRRQEFENVFNPKEIALYFQLHTLNYDFRYNFAEINGYKLSIGMNGMYQHSLNKGNEILLPEYNLFDVGVFAIASKNWGRLDMSGGLRFDYRHQDAGAFELHPHDHDHDDHAEGEEHHHKDEDVKHFPSFSRHFSGLSASLGFTYQLSDNWHTKLNFSHGFRAPNISELASQGSHEGAIRYEIGNHDLKSERSWQADLGIGYSSTIVSGEISFFANRINNYIFSHKLLDEHGHDLITDGHRTFQFVSGDARLLGGEISIDVHPIERLHIQNSFSYVSSVQLHESDSTKYLPFTPAPKLVTDIRFDLIRHGKRFNNMYISLGTEVNFKQDKVYSAYGTEIPTASYTLLNAGFGTDILHRGKRVASVFFTANNLTDKGYQNHLSRLKYANRNVANGRTGVHNMGRNFGFKVLVPLSF